MWLSLVLLLDGLPNLLSLHDAVFFFPHPIITQRFSLCAIWLLRWSSLAAVLPYLCIATRLIYTHSKAISLSFSISHHHPLFFLSPDTTAQQEEHPPTNDNLADES